MSKFEQIGISAQYDAANIHEANKAFTWSCKCCCNKGVRLECDKCSIQFVHNLVVANFNDMKTLKA